MALYDEHRLWSKKICLGEGRSNYYLICKRIQIKYRASIDRRNPILSNRLSSSLCSRRIGVELNERHNKTAQSSSLLTFCEFEAHCFPA